MSECDLSPVTVITWTLSLSITSSIVKSTFQNLSSTLITCWIKFFHVLGVQLLTPSIKSFFMFGSLNVVFIYPYRHMFVSTYLFTEDNASPMWLNSQWYGGVRNTVIFFDFTCSSITYALNCGLMRFALSMSYILFIGLSNCSLFSSSQFSISAFFQSNFRHFSLFIEW